MRGTVEAFGFDVVRLKSLVRSRYVGIQEEGLSESRPYGLIYEGEDGIASDGPWAHSRRRASARVARVPGSEVREQRERPAGRHIGWRKEKPPHLRVPRLLMPTLRPRRLVFDLREGLLWRC